MVKNSKDLIQGISKLDYLLKVSVFQKYKDKSLEERKWTMFTDGVDSDHEQNRDTEESMKYRDLMTRLSEIPEA